MIAEGIWASFRDPRPLACHEGEPPELTLTLTLTLTPTLTLTLTLTLTRRAARGTFAPHGSKAQEQLERARRAPGPARPAAAETLSAGPAASQARASLCRSTALPLYCAPPRLPRDSGAALPAPSVRTVGYQGPCVVGSG